MLAAASRYLGSEPRTIVSIRAARSPGDRHDYYSEGDYWWPDPSAPAGPHVRRDGFSNPARFDAHRQLLIRFSVEMPCLVAAWTLTGDRRFAHQAADHLRTWFVDPATRMNPDLDHAQAIVGLNGGRGIGIIDTVHLVEVARAARILADADAPGYSASDARSVTGWFARYLDWMSRSPNGRAEAAEPNNHGSCWLLQVAAFSDLCGDRPRLRDVRERFRDIVVPHQIAPDGSQPLELARTKPYGYCLFNLDILATLCQSASTADDDLWSFETPDGRGIAKAIAWMAPFIADKRAWPRRPDVEHFSSLPVRQPSLLFGGEALGRTDWTELWRRLPADPSDPEIIRNYPIRQPLLWF